MKSITKLNPLKGGESMKKIVIILLAAILTVLAFTAVAYAAKSTSATTNLIVGRPAKGMYCADPLNWIKDGYKIYVWGDATPIRAQAYDAGGHLINPGTGITWSANGGSGSMSVLDSTNKVYAATPANMGALVQGDNNYTVTYTADGKSFSGVVRRWNSDCDGCHATPPAHALANAGSNGVSTCRNSGCHTDFGWKMKTSHASRVSNNTSASACYSCHPSPCYSGVHNQYGIDCVSCHGSLADAASGKGMWVPGSKGLPKCDNCHVSPYIQNTGKQFKESVGHGKTKGAKNLCITCHNSMHMEEDPEGKWGGAYQTSNNCSKCHTTQATDGNMGPVCGNCHVSSTNPHIVKK